MDWDKLLDELEKEIHKFTKADDEKIRALVDTLVEAGVYPKTTPAMERHDYTPLNMANGWGARWHIWREPQFCPKCNADLRDHEAGPPFKRELLNKPDDYFTCPDCKEVIGHLYGGFNENLH